MRPLGALCVVVLAGGEGRRLADLTRDPTGRIVPKQFFEFHGKDSLLKRTLGRIALLPRPVRLLAMVQEAHRRWWGSGRYGLDPRDVVAEPANRGTGVAILHATYRTLERDRDPCLLVLPSDHGTEDEDAWIRTLERAVAGAMADRDHPVLVGMRPPDDEGYGWIMAGPKAPGGTHHVAAFLEKPAPWQAAALRGRGALCSTFAFASSAVALLRLYQRHAPALVASFARFAVEWDTAPATRAQAFAALPFCDFSRDLLEPARGEVRVLPGEPCGWSDLGTPARLERWSRRASEPVETPLATAAGLLTA